MSNLIQSTVSPKAFPLPSRDSDISLKSQQSRKATWPRTVVIMAAWIEIIVGASFLLAPRAQSQLIYSATPEGVGVYWARFAGIGLIALGIACMPSKLAETGAVRGLVVFNIAVTIFFAWVAVATTFQGVVLWPVVILHTVITIALAFVLRHSECST